MLNLKNFTRLLDTAPLCHNELRCALEELLKGYHLLAEQVREAVEHDAPTVHYPSRFRCSGVGPSRNER